MIDVCGNVQQIMTKVVSIARVIIEVEKVIIDVDIKSDWWLHTL